MTSLVVIIVLLAVNAFFVAAEFALVKAHHFRIERLAEAGSRSARMTATIQKNLEAYLAACQLGITMASLGLGWVGEPAVAALLEPLFHSFGMPDAALHTVSFILGFLIFSSLHIVVGEQVPKTFAIRKAERVSMLAAYPLHLAYLIVWPLNWVLNNASRSILRLFNVEEATHGEVFTDEELKGLVTVSSEHGSMEQQKAEMLRNLFEFDLHDVQRIMIPRHAVTVLDVAEDIQKNRFNAFNSGHSRFPLIDSDNGNQIIGVVLIKSLYKAMLEAGQEGHDPWGQLEGYSNKPLIVPESQKIAPLFEMMREQRNHISLVVDEYGQLSGIVTLEDLLEEIVGEIADEGDDEPIAPAHHKKDEHTWQVDGLMTIGQLERMLDFELDKDVDANSVSGLIMQRLERMPLAGDEIEESGYRFTIIDLLGSRVGQVLVARILDDGTGESLHNPRPGQEADLPDHAKKYPGE
jgi:CBS domain containing-hemolysin-like protein